MGGLDGWHTGIARHFCNLKIKYDLSPVSVLLSCKKDRIITLVTDRPLDYAHPVVVLRYGGIRTVSFVGSGQGTSMKGVHNTACHSVAEPEPVGAGTFWPEPV